MSNDILILSHSSHPLYEQLKTLSLDLIDIDNEDLRINVETEIVFDCTILNYKKKFELLDNFSSKELVLISDTSHINGEKLQKEAGIRGAMALSFPSPTQHLEFYAENTEIALRILSFLRSLNLEGVEVEGPGIGFIYPRVISQIINEAYYALEEDLASPEAIDTAMKFGVNYPLGPIEWKEKIGTLPIVQLLDELLETTGDKRYLCSSKLRAEL